MTRKLSILFLLISFMLGACGNGVDDGDNLTSEQKLLQALDGTWIGTADGASTMSGSKRVVFTMTLPADERPSLEGLTGTIWFGEEIDTSQCDPKNPPIVDGRVDFIRDGYVFELINMAIVKNRLMAGFNQVLQWSDCCEAITDIYENESNSYFCMPTWGGDCGPLGPQGEEGCILEGPNGESVFMSDGEMALCMNACECNESSCYVYFNPLSSGVELDITVDIANGVMLGEGLGRIEAMKQ